MFIKRFLNSKREKKAVITQIVLPLLLVLCGLLLSVTQDSQDDDPKLILSLSKLKGKSNQLTAFYADLSSSSKQNKLLLKTVSNKILFCGE